MKINLTALAITALVSAAFASIQPASAEGRGARFDFAPTTYRLEESRRPKGYGLGQAHNVRNGSVPAGSNFLGLSPNMLTPAPKPQVQPQMQVAATPSFTPVTPQTAVPKANFNTAFGKPAGQPQLPVVASAPVAQPPLPQVATAQSLQPVTPAHKAAAKRPVLQTSRSVSGKLRRPAAQHAPAAMVATAGQGIDSYGKGVGYVPGAYLPSVGMTTRADVYGTLVRNR